MSRKIVVADYRTMADKLQGARLPNRLGINAANALNRLVDAYLDLAEHRRTEAKIVAAARKLCVAKSNEATSAYRELEMAVVEHLRGLQ
jgi:hypothetical protein